MIMILINMLIIKTHRRSIHLRKPGTKSESCCAPTASMASEMDLTSTVLLAGAGRVFGIPDVAALFTPSHGHMASTGRRGTPVDA